jgi:hypothetical protein
MSANHDISRVVRSWIREEQDDSADRVLQVVLSRLDTTPQRWSWWPARRIPPMTTKLRYTLVGFALVAVIVTGAATLFGSPRRDPEPPGTTAPSATTAAPSTVTGSITAAVFDTETAALYATVMAADGSNVRRLEAGPAWVPRFSPDGETVLLGAYQHAWPPDETDNDVFAATIRADGSGYNQLRFAAGYPETLYCTAWSVGGDRLFCGGRDSREAGRSGFYSVRASDGGDLQRIPTTNADGLYIPADAFADGTRLAGAYVTESEYLLLGDQGGVVGFVALDGSAEVAASGRSMTAVYQFNDEEKYPSPPSLSPDGATIVAASDGRLFLVDLDGSLPVAIDVPTSETLGTPTAAFPSWSPDGTWIVFSIEYADAEVGWDLYRIRPDGTGLTQLTATPTLLEQNPDWIGPTR